MHLHYIFSSKISLKAIQVQFLICPNMNLSTELWKLALHTEQPGKSDLLTQDSTGLLGSNEHYRCVKRGRRGMPRAV